MSAKIDEHPGSVQTASSEAQSQPWTKVDPNQPSFLDLPYNVRAKIYLEAGIVMCCTISLNSLTPDESHGLEKKSVTGGPEYFDKSELRFGSKFVGPCLRRGVDWVSACELSTGRHSAASLLRVSRFVSSEAMRLFFSRNKFVVHRCAHNGFGSLLKLSEQHLSWLSSLRIEINTMISTFAWEYKHVSQNRRQFCQCNCNQPIVNGDKYAYCNCAQADQPLDLATTLGQRVLQEFGDLVLVLRQSLNPERLDLGMICDVKNSATAALFGGGMLKLPCPLRACSIRFSTSSSEKIRDVARNVVSRLSRSMILRPVKLPAEIRWKIFEFAGLIAPGDIEWKAKGPRPGFNIHLSYFQSNHACMAIKGWKHSRSAFATSCDCWNFPNELFLLNQEHNRRAKRVFFGKNHFIILPHDGYTLAGDLLFYSWSELPTLTFSSIFHHIPDDAIRYLTSLQFTLPLSGTMRVQDTGISGLNFSNYDFPATWLSSIAEILRRSGSANLTLTLDFRTLECRPHVSDQIREDPLLWKDIFAKLAQDVKLAVSNTPGLRAFHIYPPDFLSHIGLEDHYEQLVMGAAHDNTMSQRYTQRNKCTYWYLYVTGHSITHDVGTDIILRL